MAGDAPEQKNLTFEYPRLEPLAEANLVDVIACIHDELQGNNTADALISPAFEFDHPDSMKYAAAITRIVAAERADDDALYVAYRAFHFAHTVGGLLIGQTTGMMQQEDFKGADDKEELRQKLITVSSDFFSRCPALDALTARFMSELDPTGRFSDMAEVVAGTTFAFIEEAERQVAINIEVEKFAEELADDDIVEITLDDWYQIEFPQA